MHLRSSARLWSWLPRWLRVRWLPWSTVALLQVHDKGQFVLHLQTTQAQIVSFLLNIEATQANRYCDDRCAHLPWRRQYCVASLWKPQAINER